MDLAATSISLRWPVIISTSPTPPNRRCGEVPCWSELLPAGCTRGTVVHGPMPNRRGVVLSRTACEQHPAH